MTHRHLYPWGFALETKYDARHTRGRTMNDTATASKTCARFILADQAVVAAALRFVTTVC